MADEEELRRLTDDWSALEVARSFAAGEAGDREYQHDSAILADHGYERGESRSSWGTVTATFSRMVGPSAGTPYVAAAAISLWTPRLILWMAVLAGFPGAAVLAVVDWRRMGLRRKALGALIGAAVGTVALLIFLYLLPDNLSRAVGLGVNAGLGVYLSRAVKTDTEAFEAAGQSISRRGWVSGALLGLGGSALFLGSGVGLTVLLSLAGVLPNPGGGEVHFGVRAGSDVCEVGGEKTVFASTDPIYMAAVMRETVRSGAVVLEIDQVSPPRGNLSSLPVTLEPPYDCLGYAAPVTGLSSGTYTVRFRYTDRAGKPDLATGTFTVR